jgi:DNA-binding MarR family transcriptional regulator
MGKPKLSKSNFELWLLIGRVNHSVNLIRQRELNQYDIPIRQIHVLRLIQDLGQKATLSELAKQIERQPHVISRQTIAMEKDGLIKRIKIKPKSNLLRLELTEKGLEMIIVANKSNLIDQILSFLTQEQRHQMESVLNRILANVEKYDHD